MRKGTHVLGQLPFWIYAGANKTMSRVLVERKARKRTQTLTRSFLVLFIYYYGYKYLLLNA